MLLLKNIEEKFSQVYVIILDEKFKDYGFNLINALRKKNIITTFNYQYNLKKSLKSANLNNAKFAIIIGENEFNNQKYSIKFLSDGSQKELSFQ